MVRPDGFGFNPESAATNTFAASGDATHAHQEFEGLVRILREAGVTVDVLPGPDDAPDALFPNNWFSTHGDTLILYPMASDSRQREIQPLPFRASTTHDLTAWRDKGWALEGTGSLVLDRERRIAFAAESPRTHPEAVRTWAELMGYEPVLFQTHERIYHTNVVMAVGREFAVVCSEAIVDPLPVLEALEPKAILEISRTQMGAFCGNVLELEEGIAMSQAAWEGFTPDQQDQLKAYGKPLIADVTTIERVGGGSVRCMIAELFGYPV